MSEGSMAPTLWVRVIADEAFRTALIDDPLRALAAHTDVAVSPDQVRQLVELTLTIAWYNSGVRIMGLLDIDLEDSYRK